MNNFVSSGEKHNPCPPEPPTINVKSGRDEGEGSVYSCPTGLTHSKIANGLKLINNIPFIFD